MKLPLAVRPNPAEGPYDPYITESLYSGNTDLQIACIKGLPLKLPELLSDNIYLEAAINEVEYTVFDNLDNSQYRAKLVAELPAFIDGFLETGAFDLDSGILPDRTRFYDLAFRALHVLPSDSETYEQLFKFINSQAAELTKQLQQFVAYEQHEDTANNVHDPEYEYFNASGRGGQWYLYNSAHILSLMDGAPQGSINEYTESALLQAFSMGIDSLIGVFKAGDDIFADEVDESIFYNYVSVIVKLKSEEVFKLLNPEQQEQIDYYYNQLPEYLEQDFS